MMTDDQMIEDQNDGLHDDEGEVMEASAPTQHLP